MIMKRFIEDPAPGSRVVLKERSGSRLEVWEIKQADEKQIHLIRDGEITSIDRRGLYNASYEVAWTETVPNLSESVIADLYPQLQGSRYSSHAFLVAIEKVENGIATSCLIENECEPATRFTQRPPAIELKDDGYQPGEVLLITLSRVGNNDERLVVEEAQTARTGLNAEQIREVAFRKIGPFSSASWNTGNRDDLHMEWGYHLSKHEPSRILIASIPNGKEMHAAVIHRTGKALYWEDNPEDALWAENFHPGLWIGEDISWYDAGEDGAEWAANWRRATLSDLQAMEVSYRDVEQTLCDQFERAVPVAEVASLISPEWREAYVTQDENGTDEAAGTVGRLWIEGVALHLKSLHGASINEFEIEQGGRVIVLSGRGRALACSTIHRDQQNHTVLTRWIDPDLGDEIHGKEIAGWQSKSEGEGNGPEHQSRGHPQGVPAPM